MAYIMHLLYVCVREYSHDQVLEQKSRGLNFLEKYACDPFAYLPIKLCLNSLIQLKRQNTIVLFL